MAKNAPYGQGAKNYEFRHLLANPLFVIPAVIKRESRRYCREDKERNEVTEDSLDHKADKSESKEAVIISVGKVEDVQLCYNVNDNSYNIIKEVII